MEQQEPLYDSEAFSFELVQGLLKAFDAPETDIKQEVYDQLQRYIESRLSSFDLKYRLKAHEYDLSLAENKRLHEFHKEEADRLQQEVETEVHIVEQKAEESSKRWKAQVDEVSRSADKDREKYEKLKVRLQNSEHEAKEETRNAKNETAIAAEDRDQTYSLLQESKQTISHLEKTIAELSADLRDVRLEAANWERETHNAVNQREEHKADNKMLRQEVDPIKSRNRSLTQEVTNLKRDNKKLLVRNSEQAQRLRKLGDELAATREQTKSPEVISRQSTPTTPSEGLRQNLEDQLYDVKTPTTSRSGSAISGSDPEEFMTPLLGQEYEALRKENDRLRESIEKDHVPRDVHDKELDKKIKELADLEVERDGLKNETASCETERKKLREDSDKDNARIRNLDSEIKALEKKIKGLEKRISVLDTNSQLHQEDLNRHKARIEEYEKQLRTTRARIVDLEDSEKDQQTKIASHEAEITRLEEEVKTSDEKAKGDGDDLAKRKDQIQTLEKQLKVERERISDLEKAEREQRTEIANQNTTISDLKNKRGTQSGNASSPGPVVGKVVAEIARLQEELKRGRQELEEMTEKRDSALRRISEAEKERDDATLELQSIESLLGQRDEAQDFLNEGLLEESQARERLRRAVEKLLDVDMNLGDPELRDLSPRIRQLAGLRRDAFKLQERLISLANQAADDYQAATGEKFTLDGFASDADGRLHVSASADFGNSIQALFDNFKERIQGAQDELKKSANAAADDAAAQETIKSMQEQLDTLEKNNKDHENKARDLNDKISSMQEQIDTLEENNRGLESKAKDFKDNINTMQVDIDTFERKTRHLERKAKDLEDNNKELDTKAEDLEKNNRDLEKKNKALEKRGKDLEQSLQASQDESAKYTDRGSNHSQGIRDVRALLRAFLAKPKVTWDDADELLNEVCAVQKRTPNVTTFNHEGQLAAARLKNNIESLKLERQNVGRLEGLIADNKKKLKESNAERKRLVAAEARLTSELDALRQSQSHDSAQTEKDLAEKIGNISGEIQKLKDESEEERTRHREEVEEYLRQQKIQQDALEKERGDHKQELKRARADVKAASGSSDDTIQHLNKEIIRIADEKQTAEDSCAKERKRLEAEIKRLENENRRLTSELRDLQAAKDLDEQAIARVTEDLRRRDAELETMRAAFTAQNSAVAENGEQAQESQEALENMIEIMNEGYKKVMHNLDLINQRTPPEGVVAAEKARIIKAAREEIHNYVMLLEEARMQRDRWEDIAKAMAKAEREGLARIHENAAAETARAVAAAVAAATGADGGNAGAAAANNDGAGARAGAAPGARAGRRSLLHRAIAGTGNFIGHTSNHLLTTFRYGTVWGTLAATFVMMMAVIVAEGRQYAEWQHANEHSRALWMVQRDRPSICLGPPNMDYFWHTLVMLLSGRWIFR